MLVKKQDPLLVAEAARNSLGTQWDRHLKAALYEGLSELSPSALHIAAAGHMLTGVPGDTTLITLNFDDLLEIAIRLDSELPVVSSVDGREFGTTNVVHHLHGVVSRDGVREVVLTLSDFNEILGDQASWQLEVIRKAVRRGATLIVGTSYRDPDLRRWLHVALADHQANHSTLVLLARQGFGLTREAFGEVEEALIEQWRAVGLVPVIVEDFSDAAQIIRELHSVPNDGYLSPQERAKAVWDAHDVEFAFLQQAYSDQLVVDADKLRDALDVDRLNVSLWLADAEGNLARWAAQDRIFRHIADIRRVPSGHDSPWIAGRALGSESILFQDLKPGGTRRWSTVLAVPVRVEWGELPEFATAVLSVGLPGSASEYESSSALWLDVILNIANEWSSRLVDATPAR